LTTKTALGDSTAQLRSEIPDVSGFLTSETDPVYTASEAANITSTDITNLGNLSGTNTGDQDISGLATKAYVDQLKAKINSMEVPLVIAGVLTVSIGDSFGGGIVAYIFQSGDPGYVAGETHGLIAAPGDQSVNKQWYNGSYITTGAGAFALGTGKTNTNNIVSSQGAGSYAARLCTDLVLGGYSDWFLPSNDELNKLYINRVAIGGFASDYYWSSSEVSNNWARVQDFASGRWASHDKGVNYRVRAVRAF
jgi:hypothetical protein